jgi:hypothetical protein
VQHGLVKTGTLPNGPTLTSPASPSAYASLDGRSSQSPCASRRNLALAAG